MRKSQKDLNDKSLSDDPLGNATRDKPNITNDLEPPSYLLNTSMLSTSDPDRPPLGLKLFNLGARMPRVEPIKTYWAACYVTMAAMSCFGCTAALAASRPAPPYHGDTELCTCHKGTHGTSRDKQRRTTTRGQMRRTRRSEE